MNNEFITNHDFQFTTTVKKLWIALTEPSKLSQWIAENDLKPVVGHRFQFRHQPNEYWDGVVESEVLIVDETNRLSFTWAVGEERHTVTLTLEDLGNGNDLKKQASFQTRYLQECLFWVLIV